jgi:tRNA-splicing ligase RtcB
MRVYQTDGRVGGLPIKSWCMNPEQGAIDQAYNLAKLPFAFKHIALMPDTHQGYGMPIGGVLATSGYVIPNAVGVDVGCGMLSIKTGVRVIHKDILKAIMGDIRKVVPVGFNHQAQKQDDRLMPTLNRFGVSETNTIVDAEYDSALKQLGTLGGGNHFIEIQMGSDGFVYIMIHSGSRNLGKKVCDHYNKIAKELNGLYHSVVDPKWDLAFLPLDSEPGRAYMSEMQYCVDFALANRKLMAENIKKVFAVHIAGIEFEDEINIAHNYARLENHYGKNVLVHRKGATAAYDGQLGIIPGSQGTSSYIVKGKGNIESFMSCSHGAGRAMGRKQAQRTLVLADEIKRLDDIGVIHGIRNAADLDEASGAYKSIDVVMEEQRDLVDIVMKLTPLAVIKG